VEDGAPGADGAPGVEGAPGAPGVEGAPGADSPCEEVPEFRATATVRAAAPAKSRPGAWVADMVCACTERLVTGCRCAGFKAEFLMS
jgi:hypothetical protein